MRLILCWCLLGCVLLPAVRCAGQSSDAVDLEVVNKIKEEGLERSQVMETISYLTDVYGPRLTGSPDSRTAADWTLKQLGEWGMENCHLETWGPFGRGWTLEQCSVNLVEPIFSPLIAHVKAWSPSTTRNVRGVPIFMDVQSEEDLEKYRGKLGRAIVLISPPREVKALFEPPGTRKTVEELLALANSQPPSAGGSRRGGSRESSSASPSRTAQPAAETPDSTPAEPAKSEEKPPAPKVKSSTAEASDAPAEVEKTAATEEKAAEATSADSKPAESKPALEVAAEKETAEAKAAEQNIAPEKPAEEKAAGEQPAERRPVDPRTAMRLQSDKWQLAYTEGAAVILEPGRGDGGNVFVASVTMPLKSDDSGEAGNRMSRGPRPWATESTDIIPQAVMAAEHYNRLVRMLQKGAEPVVEVDIVCQFHNDDKNSFNIIAEIPGTDLKDEIVMLGAHFDSWQAGTGATDNGVGCGVAMEAIRILKAIDAKPRRTIRLALWTGEEQGLLGSRAYVEQHFGKIEYDSEDNSQSAGRGRPRATYRLTPEQEKISAYYNLDNGTGKIRGIYLQGNEQLRSVFRTWLTPFADMDASTVAAGNTGGTDHQSFDALGIPGFQFIQDPVEYNTRTHHSSMDVYERIQEDDVKQASIIMASFAYHTAMRDEKLERKPLNGKVVVVEPTATETPVEAAAEAILEEAAATQGSR